MIRLVQGRPKAWFRCAASSPERKAVNANSRRGPGYEACANARPPTYRLTPADAPAIDHGDAGLWLVGPYLTPPSRLPSGRMALGSSLTVAGQPRHWPAGPHRVPF